MVSIQTVVLPTDDSACAEAARPTAERVARQHGAALHVLHVDRPASLDAPLLDPPPDPADVIQPDGTVEARRCFPAVAEAIVRYAAEVEADLVVMGTHGRTGFSRAILGSTAEQVLRQAPCPVLTVTREAEPRATGPIVIPVAFTSASDAALETAAALAEAEGARLVVLHVVEPIDVPVPYALTIEPFEQNAVVERVRQTLGRWVADRADGSVPVTPEVRVGTPASQIVRAVREHEARLVVQASHGRRGVGRWLLGSVAEEVVREVACPVLTLRTGMRALVASGAGEAAVLLPVPREDWAELFDVLSAWAADGPRTVTVERVSTGAGEAVVHAAPFLGISFDAHDATVEVRGDGREPHVVRPFSVRTEAGAWSLDAARDASAPGPWAVEVVRANGVRERITVRTAPEARPA